MKKKSIPLPILANAHKTVLFQAEGCSLHLSQKFAQLYPLTRGVPILSSKSAPGIILATGSIGTSLKNKPGIFLSRDAGLTWKQVCICYQLQSAKMNHLFQKGTNSEKQNISGDKKNTQQADRLIQQKNFRCHRSITELLCRRKSCRTSFTFFHRKNWILNFLSWLFFKMNEIEVLEF